jgi:hypothetical protein
VKNYTQISRELAGRLPPGDHHLYNDALREAYGISRVTEKSRTEIATELERVGLTVLSDPAHEPLVVRKVVRAPVAGGARPWWRRGWAIGLGALLLLLLIVGIASGPSGDGEGNDEPDATATAPDETDTEESPAEAMAAAKQAVDADDYDTAMEIAAELGEGEATRIARRISRRIGRRALRALTKGDRRKAGKLLRTADAEGYPSTSELRTAEARYEEAVARAKERAAAKRQARREARAQERAERRAQREAEEAAQAPDPEDDASPAPDSSGPSTTNWCGKRDGDGDGIYCEGE